MTTSFETIEEAFQIQLVQLHKYLKVIYEELLDKDLGNLFSKQIKVSEMPLIFAGDFNAVPESASVDLIKSGKILPDHYGLTRHGKILY